MSTLHHSLLTISACTALRGCSTASRPCTKHPMLITASASRCGWTALNCSVASIPSTPSSVLTPPGWWLRKSLTSKTRPPTATQPSPTFRCCASSACEIGRRGLVAPSTSFATGCCPRPLAARLAAKSRQRCSPLHVSANRVPASTTSNLIDQHSRSSLQNSETDQWPRRD